jgi:hypothetical protein
MFRFTIRELVLLTVMVAIGVGWWLDRRSLVKSHEFVLGELRASDRKWSATIDNERRIANLRAMESWGRSDWLNNLSP